jgi:uncharacterized protein YbbK (DUF523 family)
MKTQKILISACLLGENVKYDGSNNSILKNSFIQKLLNLNMLIPICPEVEGGLSTPRVPVEIIDNKAINQIGEDKTLFFQNGAQKALSLCKKHNIKYAILKFRSPSCGSDQIYDGTFSHTLINGDGICAKLLKQNGISIFTENKNSIKKLEDILK